MNYKHMMIFMMSVLCCVANVRASQADETYKVTIKIECVPCLPSHQPFETNVELSPDDYKAMCENTADWARKYLAIPHTVRFGVYISDDVVDVFFDGKTQDACVDYLRLRDIAQANLDSWGHDVRNQHFLMVSLTDAEKYNKYINVPFAHACVREYIKNHQDTFGSIDNVRRMAERNKIVRANEYLDKDVQDMWSMWVDQACICLHDRVRTILSGVIKSSSSSTSSTADDIWLCSYVYEREAGKKMIESWMSKQQLTPDQKKVVEQFIAGKSLADKNKSVLKEDEEQRTSLFESKISMLNKKLIVPALVCAAGGLLYCIYRYVHGKNNDAAIHEKCKQPSSCIASVK